MCGYFENFRAYRAMSVGLNTLKYAYAIILITHDAMVYCMRPGYYAPHQPEATNDGAAACAAGGHDPPRSRRGAHPARRCQ
jgi:hypothetical protein